MKPTLAKSLIMLFSILVLIESAIIGIFCMDIQNADDTARKQLDAVSISIELGALFGGFEKVATAVRTATDHPDREDLKKEAEIVRAEYIEHLQKTVQKCVEFGGDSASLKNLETAGFAYIEATRKYKQSTSEITDAEIIKEVAGTGKKCLAEFYMQLRRLHKVADSYSQNHPLGIPPMQLLNLAAIINLVYLIAFAMFVDRSISGPLGSLTAACEKIRQRLPLGNFKMARTEIGALQSSFQTMSEQIIENEKRRNSYIALLQTVQITALTRVTEQVQKLASASEPATKMAQRLERALKSLETLVALLHSMTAQLSQTDVGRVIARPEDTDASALLQGAAMSVDALLQERSIKLELPETDFRLNLDPLLIGRVLLNFLSNAIKYSPQNATVILTATLSDGIFYCGVKDSGPGISEEGRAKLFRRFSQLEALDGVKRSGTGLGLVICKDIVEAHHGQIGCDSTPGKGSLFWFKIPQSTAALSPATTQGSATPRAELVRVESGRGVHSIKTSFFVVLVMFIAAQSYLFFDLHKLFSESTQRTESFGKMKEQLFRTEELYAAYLLFTKQVQMGYVTNNLMMAKRSMPFFKEERNKLAKFVAELDQSSVAFDSLLLVRQHETKLGKVMSYYMDHMDEIVANPEVAKYRIESVMHDIETAYTKAIDMECKAFQTSFDWSQDLRNKIMQLLISAAVADVVIISAAAFIGLGLAGKILVLKSKTESFAAGQQITPSLRGKDELSYLDNRLCQVAAEIEQGEQEKKEILAIINHDLRTPLASVYSTIQVLNQGVLGELAQQQRPVAKDSEKVLQRLLSQINDLLMLEKIDAGSYEPSRQQLSLQELMQSSLINLANDSAEKKLDMSIDWNGGSINTYLFGDRVLLQRLFEIVLQNAISASANGQKIRVSVNSAPGAVLLEIEDSGPGIDPELLPNLFERFRFIDAKPLAGFGLPLADRICKLHNGSIKVKSGRPCIVEISLPAGAGEIPLSNA